MTIVLERLQGLFDVNIRDSGDNKLSFKCDNLAYFMRNSVEIKARVAPAMLVVEQESSLILEYKTLRDVLEITLKSSPQDEARAIILVKEALRLSKLIHHTYTNYVNDRPILRRSLLKSHQDKYILWLNHKDHEWMQQVDTESANDNLIIADLAFTKDVLNITDTTNPYRLGVLRARRLMLLLIPFINNNYYTFLMFGANGYLTPIITYLGVFFFLPRLVYNLINMMKHVIEHDGMSEDEKFLGAFTRFCVQWDRMWPNLTNDAAWATNGILMCFVFTGSWLPFGIYLAVCMQLYDAVLASVRAYIELTRLNKLEVYYTKACDSDVNNLILQDYLVALQKNINQTEKRLLYLSLSNFYVLLIGICLALPLIITLHPLLPVIGAILAVGMTVYNATERARLTSREPNALDGDLLSVPITREEPVEISVIVSPKVCWALAQHTQTLSGDDKIDETMTDVLHPANRLRTRSSSLNLFKSTSIDSFKRTSSESRLYSPATVSQSFSRDALHKIDMPVGSPSIV